jgi:hypothetical protein
MAAIGITARINATSASSHAHARLLISHLTWRRGRKRRTESAMLGACAQQ